ncbi:MAG: flagellar hook capping protein [Alphaproteobacteria bacterium]|nr:flagellar hook capping protein [Alphaproteobacteria bacterium]
MTDMISFVTPPSTSTGTNSTAELSGNFDTFLKILTAQIQNQDPLQPMDSSQFTQQLVQFSGVEQQIKTNSSLDTLISASNSTAGAALSGYLGQYAEINSDGAQFSGDPIHWKYSLPSDAATSTVTVQDAAGHVLYSETGETAAGSHDFIWDGTQLNGQTASDGPYWISVIAKSQDGTAITPQQSVIAKISGVDLSYGEPALTTSAGVYSYSDVKRLTEQ